MYRLPEAYSPVFFLPSNSMFRGLGPSSIVRYADLIVPRGGDNHVAITLIVQNIALKLKQEGDLRKLYPNLFTLRDGSQIRGLHTIFRCRNTSREVCHHPHPHIQTSQPQLSARIYHQLLQRGFRKISNIDMSKLLWLPH